MSERGDKAAVGDRPWGLLAEFETPAAIFEAAQRVRTAGYRWWDCHTPFPVHGLDKAMGIRPTILPWLVMACGLGGATFGFLLQWFTNATSFEMWALVWVRGYDFLVSGKPPLSGAVYPIVMFELTVLAAAMGCVVLLMLLNKLPCLYHPCFKSERFLRATDDRFFIVIEARDPLFSRGETEEFLRSLGPDAVEELET
jgi:hypothetical protein